MSDERLFRQGLIPTSDPHVFRSILLAMEEDYRSVRLNCAECRVSNFMWIKKGIKIGYCLIYCEKCRKLLWYKKVQGGFVYIFRQHQLYKIGQSIDPDKRFLSFVTGNPFPMENMGAWYVGIKTVVVEQGLHRMFRNKRMKGEWFALDDDDFMKAVSFIQSFEVSEVEGIMDDEKREVKIDCIESMA